MSDATCFLVQTCTWSANKLEVEFEALQRILPQSLRTQDRGLPLPQLVQNLKVRQANNDKDTLSALACQSRRATYKRAAIPPNIQE